MNDSPTQPSILTLESGDHHPRLGSGELLLRHRNDVDNAGLEADGDAAADRRGEHRNQAFAPRDDVDAAEAQRRANADGAGQSDTLGRAHVDPAPDLITHFEHAVRLLVLFWAGE